jgi:hypothetical protein
MASKKSKVERPVRLAGKKLTWDEFLDVVRDRLHLMHGGWARITRESGLTYRWLRTFAHAEKADVTPSMVFKLANRLGIRYEITVDIPKAQPGR